MADIRILLAGESWVSNSTHFKGWDYFSSTVYEVGTEYLEKALKVEGFAFEHLPGHLAAARFPQTRAELDHYDVVILSDLGANTLLLHPDTWLRGQPTPNRLKLLAGWVEDGGGLAMCGGYMSFAGIAAAAKYYRTPIEALLPVNIYPFDDRLEVPEGAQAALWDAAHPVVAGLADEWPLLLGYNELTLKSDAHLIATVGEHPLLAVRTVGRGRTLAWASDIGPHWCPAPFLAWSGYARLWQNAVRWLAGRA
jgi:uncharacterized membrane protein